MKKDLFFRTAISAAILSFAAGTALAAGPQLSGQYAQASQPGMESGGGKSMESPAAPGASSPGEASGSGATSAPPAASLAAKEGMDVVSTEGKKIGEVSKIEGDQIIVEVGGFLGIGAREVALDQNQLQMSGTGDEAKLQTTLSEQELEALPKYESSSMSGSGSAPATGGAPTR